MQKARKGAKESSMSFYRIAIEWSIVVLSATAVFIRRKRINLVQPLLLTLCMTFFALLTPAGKVLAQLGPVFVTKDALTGGLHKSALFTGTVFLSQFVTSWHMQLPGKAGAFIALVFSYVDALTSTKISFSRGHIIEAIDKRLLEAESKSA